MSGAEGPAVGRQFVARRGSGRSIIGAILRGLTAGSRPAACRASAWQLTDDQAYCAVLGGTRFPQAKALTSGFTSPLPGEGRGIESLSADRFPVAY